MPPKKAGKAGQLKGSKKRAAADLSSSEDDAAQTQQAPRPKKKAAKKDSTAQTQDSSKVAVGPVEYEHRTDIASILKYSPKKKTNFLKSSDIKIPLDEHCPLTNYQVYIDGDDVIYDASLNQAHASDNKNKFYRLQLLRDSKGEFKTWSRWGRVGERGQNKILGNGSLDDAVRQFQLKFKDKSGLKWEDRGENPKSNKYAFIERSYAEDSDEEEQPSADVDTNAKVEVPASKLAPAVQELMALIFNQQYFNATMTHFNYDANKLPLGKLSKNTILRGYQALKDLSALLNDASLAQSKHGTSFQEATEQLSNSFYTLIPHAFGRNHPPVIRDQDILKKEVDMLDSLSDMKNAASIMKNDSAKDVEVINELDRRFKGLDLDEMTSLKRDSTEFIELKNYLMNTRGSTHNADYQVCQIFRVERQGEKQRFNKIHSGPPRDRRLLWHGSRCTNFGGILSQGLRIAPPEAPVSGYMFGKGIYLADMSSKSANYCASYNSNGNALLLLCETELGDPMQVLTNASYTADEDAKTQGLLSTWGQGTTGPKAWKNAKCVHPSLEGVKMPDTTKPPGPTKVKDASLLYNEYIAYDVSQVRLRYLFQVIM